jgi:FKBP-type peptidyl-prolyl cis-trans isomerase (trigger factor)
MQQASQIKRDPDGTITLTITIPADAVTKAWGSEVENATKNATVQGFRKGKAPAKIVEGNLDQEKVREDVLRKLLPQHYMDAVKEHSLNPIVTPKIHVQKMEQGSAWEFTATTAEAPEVKLNNYKDAVKTVTAKSKIIIPGKEPTPPSLDELLAPVLETATVSIPSIIVEGQVERLLSQLLDEIKTLGLTLEQYLASTNKTAEDLKKEYTQKAETDIKLEFILQQIAEDEKITIEQREIDEALAKTKDENERQALQSNIYMLASILRQQKTIDFLRNL